MKNTLKHKGFVGSIEYEDGSYHGKILYIADLVTYEAKTIEGLGVEFKISVDDYINLRNELGKRNE
jgi:predicted HicB family RNase H-like nuclease